MSENERMYSNAVTMKSKYNETLIILRLQAKELLGAIEHFLRGTRIIEIEEDGDIMQKIVQVTRAKLNAEGIESIMTKLHTIINPQVVQGNFLQEQWWRDYVADFRENLAIWLSINAYEWSVPSEADKTIPDIPHFNKNYEGIIDTICEMVEPYMTRLLFNEERISYADTMQSQETNVVQRGGGIPFFKNK